MDITTIFWAVGFPLFLFFVGLATGTVVAMTDSQSAGFLLARLCYIFAAITFVVFSAYWIYAAKLSFGVSAIFSAIVGIVAVPGLVISLWWVREVEGGLSSKLFPADLPLPTIAEKTTIPTNALIVIYGSNISWATRFPHIVIEAPNEVMLSIDKDRSGSISVQILKIFDDRDDIIARIDEDTFWVQNSTRAKRPDKSTLVIYDHNDDKVLTIKYINSRAIYVEGIFRNPRVKPSYLVVSDKDVVQMPNNNTLSESVFGEMAADISLTKGGGLALGRAK